MRLNILVSFLCAVMTVRSEIESFVFEEFVTTVSPVGPSDNLPDWLQNIIDSIGKCGLIAIAGGILLCICCLCVGTCCYFRRKRKGGSSFYEYYSDIEV
eukprot:UN07561